MGWFSDITEKASSFFDSPTPKAPEPAPAPPPAPVAAASAPVANAPPAAAAAAHSQYADDAIDEAAALDPLKQLDQLNAMVTATVQMSTNMDIVNTAIAKSTAESLASIGETAQPIGVSTVFDHFGVGDSKRDQMKEQLAGLSPEIRAKVLAQMREQGVDQETIDKATSAVEAVNYLDERAKEIDTSVGVAEKAAKSGKTGALADSLDKMTPEQREEAMSGMSTEACAAAEKVLEQRRARLELAAERLDEAMSGGTDEVAVLTNLTGLSASEAAELQEIYAEKYTDVFGDPRNLRDDLVGEFGEEDDETALVRAALSGDTETAARLSEELTVSYLTSETRASINADEAAINELLRAHNKNPAAAQKIRDAYYNATGRTLETDCADVMDDAETTEMHANVAGDRRTANAAVIEQGDEDRIERVVEDVELEGGESGLVTLAKDVQDLTGEKITDITGDAVDERTSNVLASAETTVAESRDAKLDAALEELQTNPEELAKSDAKAMHVAAQLQTELSKMDLDGDRPEVTKLLATLSPAEVKLVMRHYRDGSVGEVRDLEVDLRENLDGRDLKVANAVLGGDKVLAAVALVQQARDGVGTDVVGMNEAMALLGTKEEREAFHAMIDTHEGASEAYGAIVTSETTSFDRDALNAAGIVDEDERVATMAQVKMNRNAYGGTIATWKENLGDYLGDVAGETPEARAKRRQGMRENDWSTQLSNLGGSEDEQLDAMDSIQNERQLAIFQGKVLQETGMSVEENVLGEMSGHHAQAGLLYNHGMRVEAQGERMVADLDNWIDDREDAASKRFENPHIDEATRATLDAMPLGPERDAAVRKATADARLALLAAADRRAKLAEFDDYHSMLMSETSDSQLAVAEDRIAMGEASDVNALYDAGGTLGFGKDTATIYRVLDERTPEQMEQFATDFEKAHPGEDFEQWVMSRARSPGERRDLEIKLKGNYGRLSDDDLAKVAAEDPMALIERAEGLQSAARDGGEVPSIANFVSNQVTDQVSNADDRLDGRMEDIERIREKIEAGETLTPDDHADLVRHTRYMSGDSSEFTRTKTETVNVGADAVATVAEVAVSAAGGIEVAGLVGDAVRMNINSTFNAGRYSDDQAIADHVKLATSALGTLAGEKNPLKLGEAEKKLFDAGVDGALGGAGDALGNTQNLNGDFGKLVDATGRGVGSQTLSSVLSALTGVAAGKGIGGQVATNTVEHLASGDDSKSVLEQFTGIGLGSLKGWVKQTAHDYHESKRKVLPDGANAQIDAPEVAPGEDTTTPPHAQASTDADGTGDSLEPHVPQATEPTAASD